ncbi:MAG: hypothetical protein LC122_11735 [Chitinophagales bacterium]|nr:hypothetical protein [Chitinophagales bacterium]
MNTTFTDVDHTYKFALYDEFNEHLNTIFEWWNKSIKNNKDFQCPYAGIAFFICKYFDENFIRQKINWSIAYEIEHKLNVKAYKISNRNINYEVALILKKYNLLKDKCIFDIKGLI